MDLPENINLLTLERLWDDSVLIRLEHTFQGSDNAGDLSKPVAVTLKVTMNIFA